MIRWRWLALCALVAAGAAWPWPRDLAPSGAIRGAQAATIRIAPPAADLTTGLVAYWPLAAVTLPTAQDVVGGHHATLTGAPSPSAGYLTFDGLSQYGTINAPAILAGSRRFSLAVWVRKTASTVGVIYRQTTATASVGRVQVSITASGLLQFSWRDGATEGSAAVVLTSTPSTVPLNQWRLVIATWDADAGRARIYIGATQVNSADQAMAALGTGASVRARIASGTDTPAQFFPGALARLRIYEGRVLDEAARAALLAEGAP